MGHSSIQVTFDRYGHLMPGSEAEVAGLLDTYLGTSAPRSLPHKQSKAPVSRDKARHLSDS